jgi:hypothetical protein
MNEKRPSKNNPYQTEVSCFLRGPRVLGRTFVQPRSKDQIVTLVNSSLHYDRCHVSESTRRVPWKTNHLLDRKARMGEVYLAGDPPSGPYVNAGGQSMRVLNEKTLSPLQVTPRLLPHEYTRLGLPRLRHCFPHYGRDPQRLSATNELNSHTIQTPVTPLAHTMQLNIRLSEVEQGQYERAGRPQIFDFSHLFLNSHTPTPLSLFFTHTFTIATKSFCGGEIYGI